MKKRSKIMTLVLAIYCAIGIIYNPSVSDAKADIKLEDANMQLIIEKYDSHNNCEELKIGIKKGKKIKIQEITYEVADSNVVSVSDAGLVTAKNSGETSIKVNVSYNKNGKKQSTVLHQNVKILVTDYRAAASAVTVGKKRRGGYLQNCIAEKWRDFKEYWRINEWYYKLLIIFLIVAGILVLFVVMILFEIPRAVVYTLDVSCLGILIYEMIRYGINGALFFATAVILAVFMVIFSFLICECDEEYDEEGVRLCISYYFKGIGEMIFILLAITIIFIPAAIALSAKASRLSDRRY